MSINVWGSDDPMEVAKGGTGQATLTDHGVLLGNTTGDVVATAAPSDGEILIGTASATAPGVNAVTGATDEISIATGTNTFTVGLADDAVFSSTGALRFPDGTTAQEPTPASGMIRYDTDTDKMRGVENGAFVDMVSTVGGDTWTFLTSASLSDDTSLEFDSTYITTDYPDYAVVFYNLYPVQATPTQSQILRCQLSANDGSSYPTGNYAGAATVLTAESTTGTDYWYLGLRSNLAWGTGYSDATFVYNGVYVFRRISVAEDHWLMGYGSNIWNQSDSSTLVSRNMQSGGVETTGSVINNIKIYNADYNLTGEAVLYGVTSS